jgi:hypothetical protein
LKNVDLRVALREEAGACMAPTDHRLGLTLKKYRTGGEQKVTVQHVSVNDNAQAIVGNVSTGGGDGKKS